ncbi:hypothetical protein [Actinotalea sp. K2]|uniref:hypothetical protein n=1 Tax=Actinotalea sp. K2 TaxID=2939438 RepID=UPI002016A8CE|nr:hypothetical protein [Actinotalea sp. K2]MCL3862514.1 hypothetical protein [Actinotalea sp. K2]
MPPRSPLPARHGLAAARLRTPDRDPQSPAPWLTMGAWLPHPLQLLAAEIAFTDPVDAQPRRFCGIRSLPLAVEG